MTELERYRESELERYRELLRRSVEGYLESPEVQVLEGDPCRFLGNIISPTFEGMEDWERQELAWGRVYDTLDEEDHRWIEFLFTNTPAEMAAYAEADEQTAEKG
jgi:acid stress-induced BolA-like protein IbaG/YrbA